MSIEIGTIQNGEIIKAGNDIYKIVDAEPKFDADGQRPWFTAKRFIKSRGTWSKQAHSLRFQNSTAKKL